MSSPSPSPSPPQQPSTTPVTTPTTATTTTVTTPATSTALTIFKQRHQPIPWTHNETVNLIKAYQDKWYSLKRGQLKASTWEEVAVTVAARCGYDYDEPSKTSIQCRHKMEKLRRRYRIEKQKLVNEGGGRLGGRCSWVYFDLMDQLEQGPMPISARPMNDDVDEDDDVDGEEDDGGFGKSRSISCILRRPVFTSRSSRNDDLNFIENGVSMDTDDDDEEDGRRRRRFVSGMASEIRGFAESFNGIESMRIKMIRDLQRWRVEMESRQMEMVFDYERRAIDTITRVFGSNKRVKTEDDH